MKTISKYFKPRALTAEEKFIIQLPVLTRQVVRRSLRQLALSKTPRLAVRDSQALVACDEDGNPLGVVSTLIRRSIRRDMAMGAFRQSIKKHGLVA